MFGLGWQEILIILVIAVLVIGPEQLPQVARTLGKLMAQFRRVTNELRDTINREVTEQEEFKEFREFGRTLDDEVRQIGNTAQDYVEREVAKEEAELRKIEQAVVQDDGDPGPLHDPAPAAGVTVDATANVPADASDGLAGRTADAPSQPGEPAKPGDSTGANGSTRPRQDA